MLYDIFTVRAHGVSDSHNTLSSACESFLESTLYQIAEVKKEKMERIDKWKDNKKKRREKIRKETKEEKNEIEKKNGRKIGREETNGGIKR